MSSQIERCLFAVICVAQLSWLTFANPGLMSAIQKNSSKMKMVIDGMAMESSFISSSDMGVRKFNFSFGTSNPVYPYRYDATILEFTINT